MHAHAACCLTRFFCKTRTKIYDIHYTRRQAFSSSASIQCETHDAMRRPPPAAHRSHKTPPRGEDAVCFPSFLPYVGQACRIAAPVTRDAAVGIRSRTTAIAVAARPSVNHVHA